MARHATRLVLRRGEPQRRPGHGPPGPTGERGGCEFRRRHAGDGGVTYSRGRWPRGRRGPQHPVVTRRRRWSVSLTGIALRRIRPHLATWLAVLASVHVTVTTIGSLILLSSAIGDASTRGLVAAAEPSARSISVTASVPAGGLSDADEAVRAVLAPLLPRSDLTIVATTTSRGIEGQPE